MNIYMKEIIKNLKVFEEKNNLKPLREVAIFMLITIVVHYLYRFWAYKHDHRIFGVQIITPDVFDFFSDILYYNSRWVNEHLLNLKFIAQGREMYFTNPNFPAEPNQFLGWIGVNAGCSGLKQFLQFAILMILYPGTWKHKLWFIPSGILIIHITNIFRITGLSVILVKWSNQQYFTFSHDWLFRPFFYVVIFSMWVFWVEVIKKRTQKT